MKSRIKIEGFQSLERKLKKLARTFDERISRQMTSEGAEIVLTEMEALVPVRTGGLRGSLAIFDDGATVLVGPAKGGPGSRAHFIEFGTVNMAAQPFIRPAFDNTREQVKTQIGSTIRSEIDKAKG